MSTSYCLVVSLFNGKSGRGTGQSSGEDGSWCGWLGHHDPLRVATVGLHGVRVSAGSPSARVSVPLRLHQQVTCRINECAVFRARCGQVAASLCRAVLSLIFDAQLWMGQELATPRAFVVCCVVSVIEL